MAASTYEAALARLLAHEGGYTDHPSDPGGPTNFGITIHDYRQYVRPGATAADVKTMALDEAKCIYRAKYWDAQRCDDLPAGADNAVFDYGVNSGIGRSGKVLRRCLDLPDDTSVVNDMVVAAAMRADATKLVAAICDERLRFLRLLKTWSVFGKGWGRRVAEVKAFSLSLAAGAQPAKAARRTAASTGKAVVPVAKLAQQSSSGAVAAAGIATAQHAHQSGANLTVVAAVAVAAVALIIHATRRRLPMPDKVKAWFRYSITILWARVVALAGLLLMAGQSLLQDPNFSAAIQALLQPRFIPYYVIAIGLVTELARRRTA